MKKLIIAELAATIACGAFAYDFKKANKDLIIRVR